MEGYKTLLGPGEAEYVVQKSRFLGYATPAATPEAALAFLGEIRQKHRDASHHCYAYIIGQNAGIMRYSDDGEPGGTAGMPIIEVMKAQNVVDAAVVVTRYFGGVLLGAGGLVRAYSHSCALALAAAGVCQMRPSQRWMLEVAYPLWDRVRHRLGSLPAKLEQSEFAAGVTFQLLVREADAPALLEALTALTDGKIEALLTEELFYPWVEE